MESVEILDKKLIEKFQQHVDFTRVLLDGFVLLNSQKEIIRFNAMFCSIIEMRSVDVRKAEHIESILFFPPMSENKKNTPLDQIYETTTTQRIDEVSATVVNSQKEMKLILSSFPYFDDDGVLLGIFLLIRDVTAESNLQTKYNDKAIESMTDPLTSLFTRRYFDDQLEKEIRKSINYNRDPNICIMMLDLDKFKNINDTYGHNAGDYVLIETSKILRQTSRRSDILVRFGGEEIVAILMESTHRGATTTAEKFRSAIENHNFIFDNHNIKVTVSIGITTFFSFLEKKEDVLKRADECLYLAKNNGRNQVYLDFGRGKITSKEFLASNPAD